MVYFIAWTCKDTEQYTYTRYTKCNKLAVHAK